MNINLLLENLTNPALLFFILGLISVQLKSDLEIPANSSKFIAIYLLFSIGFKGGQELAHSIFSLEILWSLVLGLLISAVIPLYSFLILKQKLSIENSSAIAAAYGSVSAVTFVTAVSFLEMKKIEFGGHMVAVMALMEAPAIIVGVLLMRYCSKSEKERQPLGSVIKHSITNGSVLLIIGSLVIGFLASEKEARGIEPFVTDIFKGFLAIFLLDMGIQCGKKLSDFFKNGWFTTLFAILMPLTNGCVTALASGMFTDSIGNRFLLAILAASASYIAVPAAMKLAVPKANPSIYIPMALAVTFPFNITLGMPIYYSLILLT